MRQIIYSFFWWLAGANREILKEHIVDHDKYFQIGVAILITALMATVTGGIAFHYAINKGFEGNISLATIFASLLWGFIILNLDRFLVISMQKHGNSLIQPTAYEEFQNFMGEFVFAIPRILLAILIANIILQPLELYLFKDQISNQIYIINEQEKSKFMKIKDEEFKKKYAEYNKNKKLIEENYQAKIELLNKKVNNVKNKIKKLNDSQNTALSFLKKQLKETQKIANNNREAIRQERANGGCGVRCRQLGKNQIIYDTNVHSLIKKINLEEQKENNKLTEKEKEILKLNTSLTKYKNQIIKFNSIKNNKINKLYIQLEKDKEAIGKEKKEYEKKYQGDNIITALKAKNSLFQSDSEYYVIHYLLTLLLIIIELLPLVVKLLLPRSSYDAHLQRISYEEAMRHDTFIRDEKFKHQMFFKTLRLQRNTEYESLEKKLKKVKFSLSEL